MCHRGSAVVWRWLEDDCGGLCRKWTHSGEGPSNLQLSAPSGPLLCFLMKSIISFLRAIADLSRASVKDPSKQNHGAINYSIWRRREWQAATWDVFNECRRSQCSQAGAVKILNCWGLGNLPWLLHKQDAPISPGQFSTCDFAFNCVCKRECTLAHVRDHLMRCIICFMRNN